MQTCAPWGLARRCAPAQVAGSAPDAHPCSLPSSSQSGTRLLKGPPETAPQVLSKATDTGCRLPVRACLQPPPCTPPTPAPHHCTPPTPAATPLHSTHTCPHSPHGHPCLLPAWPEGPPSPPHGGGGWWAAWRGRDPGAFLPHRLKSQGSRAHPALLRGPAPEAACWSGAVRGSGRGGTPCTGGPWSAGFWWL